jgi:serine/threonine-protein kinase
VPRTLQFQRVIGSGAFGSVYLADLVGDRGFRRQVAVKVLLGNHPDSQLFVARVRDEARLLGLLTDEHILKVLELARVQGRDAVLMEYVEGVDLAAIVEAGLAPPPRALGEIGASLAGALHRAHQARHPGTGEPLNVIHRDVKPANVMITDRGGTKLLDFGVARARFAARESYTGQFVLGTLNYMAPEYIVTGDVSPAADMYGLALTLWEAASGEVFGQPKLKQELHNKRVEERLDRIAGSHAELVPVLRQMLCWDPRRRPDGAAVERQLIAASDMLRGTGVRAWAAEAVTKVLAEKRASAKDACGLLGQTVALDDSPPESAAPPPDEATRHNVPRPAFLDDPSGRERKEKARALPPDPGASGVSAAPPVRTSAPPAPAVQAVVPAAAPPPVRRKRQGPSIALLIVQGLLLGGFFGFVLLIAIGGLVWWTHRG